MGVASDAGTGSNASARKVVVKLVVDKGVKWWEVNDPSPTTYL